MRLRTFTASSMPAAMKLVREALGDDAVIIASEALAGKKEVRVTAAIDARDDDDLPWAKPAISPAPVPKTDARADDLRYEIQNILRFHNVPELFIAKLMRKALDVDFSAIASLHRISARRDPLTLHQMAMEALLAAFFTFEPLALEPSPSGRGLGEGVSISSESKRGSLTPTLSRREREYNGIMLVGPPGIGKTLTIAKIAAKLAMGNAPLAVITTDNKRAGGIEQLQAFTNILNIELHIVDGANALSQQLRALPPAARVLIDSAGCNPYDDGEKAELQALANQHGIEPVLVLPAGGDSLEAVDIVEAFTVLPIKRLLLTRADAAQRFGGAVAAVAAHGLRFCHVSTSPGMINALHPLDAPLLAQLLLKYQHMQKHNG